MEIVKLRKNRLCPPPFHRIHKKLSKIPPVLSMGMIITGNIAHTAKIKRLPNSAG